MKKTIQFLIVLWDWLMLVWSKLKRLLEEEIEEDRISYRKWKYLADSFSSGEILYVYDRMLEVVKWYNKIK